MEVKENLISFRVLWTGVPERIANTQKTKEVISKWLANEHMEISLILCGASKNGPIDLVLENHYSNAEVDKRLLTMHLRKLINLFRENGEIDRVWLKWNDTTDDIIWTDYEAQTEINKTEHERGDYILIHHKHKTIR